MSTKWIVLSIIASLFLLVGGLFVWTQNTAIGYEETINNDTSALQVQAQRRFDIFTREVETIQESAKYEASTQIAVTQMRTALKNGDINQAQLVLNATMEAYPDLKATANYAQFMTEISTTENMIKQYRDTYNNDVQNYKQFVRRFPANTFLNMAGYQVINYQYLTFADNNLPAHLFGNTQP
jgi:LemA protein